MNVKKQQKDYSILVKQKSPPSRLLKDMCLSFLIGGLICTLGQFISEVLSMAGISKEDAPSITSSAMIFLGAFLTGIGIYDNIARIGKAGTLVPITGFANSIVSSSMEYKSEGLILGVGAKMFTIAGPVIVYGISASVVCGLIYYLLTII